MYRYIDTRTVSITNRLLKKVSKELNDYIAHAQNKTHVFELVVVTGLGMAQLLQAALAAACKPWVDLPGAVSCSLG